MMQDSLSADDGDDFEDGAEDGALTLPPLVIEADQDGDRLDKALAWLVPPGLGLSRSRLQALIAEGAVSRAGPDGGPGEVVTNHKGRVKAGEAYCVLPPPPAPAEPAAEDIPLSVLYEDKHLVVVDKPAGMVVHPAPGAESGTLVNALLHHCTDLSGIGGQARPGIVHRIDKDTSGILVVAKTDAAHQRLSEMFAAHDLDRRYLAICWGAPDIGDPRLRGIEGVEVEPGGVVRMETQIGRHPADRKRQAVLREGQGRHAVTRFRTTERFGPMEKPVASCVECVLETGRTHQIRVHMAHAGHPLVGDTVYGRGARRAAGALEDAAREALDGFSRQALHAAVLAFEHPVTGEELRFETPPPADMQALLDALRG
ncbi:RluA family pseudouridine synthase [Rhodovulum sp. DZ06]|uniref:RluA family pseudouridine synthase n=1 Tax=Rhodovulum sp. DZ06 TaxID=3425126 RepID=UPI003D3296CF